MKTGCNNVATRIVNAGDVFVANVMDQFGKSKPEAERVLAAFRKVKAVKLDAVNGRYNLTHGAYWEQEVIDRAAK